MAFWQRRREGTGDRTGPEYGIRFGSAVLHPTEATSHFLAVGSTGSGKTTVLRQLMQSVLPQIGSGDTRALLYDAKQDLLPMLAAYLPPHRVVTLHPFDDRGVAWDIAADIRENRTAIEFAFLLIPTLQESQPFFSDACRHLMVGVLRVFMLEGRHWTFADLIRVLSDSRTLKAALRRRPETRDLIHMYLDDERLTANIMSTIATKLMVFEPIAACWEHAPRRISLEEWATTETALVLGNSEVSRHALDAINRCIVKRACDITLNGSESRTRRNWFVFDELANAGRLDSLVALTKVGRSKGACVVVAFQSISGLRDSRLYGQFATDELLGQLGNRLIGRLECPVTAEWASQLVGDQEVTMRSRSRSRGQGGTSDTVSYQSQVRRAVLPSELMNITPCGERDGLTGLLLTRTHGVEWFNLPGDELFHRELIPPRDDVPAFVPRDPDHQYLRPWSAKRARELGFPQSGAAPPRATRGVDTVDAAQEDPFA